MKDRLILGGGNFGGIGSAPELFGQGESKEEALALMDAAWEAGIRWFDTADAYGGGRSERFIGDWIRITGNRPHLTTKTCNPMTAGADRGLARDRVLRQLDSSLERLGVERIDLYLAHEFDPETPIEETFSAFEELVAAGAVGAYGVSNFDGPQLEQALAAGRPSVVQNSYSLLEHGDERDVLPLCAARSLEYQAFGPLGGGWLTGKYRRGQEYPPGSRMVLRPGPYEKLVHEQTYSALERLEEQAGERGTDMATLAFAWALAQPAVSAIVLGPRRPEHLLPALRAGRLRLSADEREAIASSFA